MLVLEAQSRAKWSINVVFFSLPTLLDALLTRLSFGQDQKPVDVEIDCLSDDDADRFFEFYVMRYIEPKIEKRVRSLYRKMVKTPGNIMALGEQKMEKRVIIRSVIGSPINIAFIVLLLLVLIGGGYYWMFNRTLPDNQDITNKQEQTAMPMLESHSTHSSSLDRHSQQENAMNSTSFEQKNVQDDSNALPPRVVETKERVGVEDNENNRVVISSDVVDALIDSEKTKKDMPQIILPSHTVITTDTPASRHHVVDSSKHNTLEKKAIVETNVSALKPTSSKNITFSYSQDELMSMSGRSYTLQLGAFRTLQEVEEFVNKYQLQHKVNIYPTLRRDVQWIIVTYHNYPTIQLARDAVDSLPSSLQRLGPWAKSLRQVQREIERAK